MPHHRPGLLCFSPPQFLFAPYATRRIPSMNASPSRPRYLRIHALLFALALTGLARTAHAKSPDLPQDRVPSLAFEQDQDKDKDKKDDKKDEKKDEKKGLPL